MNTKLILRTLASPFVAPYTDVTLGSVLSQENVDDNFIYLKGETVYSAETVGDIINLKKLNGQDIVLDLTVLNGQIISGMTFNQTNYDLTIERNDGTNFVQNLGILSSDMTITGGTFDAGTGIATFVNNSGNTFDVTGFLTGMTDTFVTGGTYNAGTATFTNTAGNTFDVNGFFTGGDTYFTSGSTGLYSIKAINDSSVDASGDYAFAEGFRTLASGIATHAEGQFSVASGEYSHAEGLSTLSSGQNSHAEGQETSATTYNTHAEGIGTLASGMAAHAEGYSSKATGIHSHAQNTYNTANGFYSHAAGSGSTASGVASFVHSVGSMLTGDRSAILGGQNIIGYANDTTYVPNLVIKKVDAIPTSSLDLIGEIGSVTWDENNFYWKTSIGWLKTAGTTF